MGDILVRLNRMENTLAEIVKLLKASPRSVDVAVKAEQSGDENRAMKL